MNAMPDWAGSKAMNCFWCGTSFSNASRRRSARRIDIRPGRRTASVLAGVILFPLALACAGVKFFSRRTGTIYVEARNV